MPLLCGRPHCTAIHPSHPWASASLLSLPTLHGQTLAGVDRHSNPALSFYGKEPRPFLSPAGANTTARKVILKHMNMSLLCLKSCRDNQWLHKKVQVLGVVSENPICQTVSAPASHPLPSQHQPGKCATLPTTPRPFVPTGLASQWNNGSAEYPLTLKFACMLVLKIQFPLDRNFLKGPNPCSHFWTSENTYAHENHL